MPSGSEATPLALSARSLRSALLAEGGRRYV